MIVYHLIPAEYGIETIRRRRLKVSRIDQLNDPFEFLGLSLQDKTLRRAMGQAKERISSLFGLHCFSASWRNPVLWSHYADRHRGICLGFEVERQSLVRVEYVEERLIGSILGSDICETVRLARRLLSTKFSHWKYEQEYRMLVELAQCCNIDGLHFSDFSRTLRLREVIVGQECRISRAALADALGDISIEVKCWKARAAFRSFRVVTNKSSAMWD